MMGYLTEKLTTVFKGPWMMYWKERGEGKKAVRWMILLRKLVFETIPEEVAKEHDITQAIKDQNKVEKIAKEIDKKTYMLAFNVEVEMEKAWEIFIQTENEWGRFIEEAKERDKNTAELIAKIDQDYQTKLIQLSDKQGSLERDAYLRFVEPVIKEAEFEGAKRVMMVRVAQLFKTKEDISRFAALAIRWGARAVRRNLKGLQKDSKGLRNIFLRIRKAKGREVRKLVNSLKVMDDAMVVHAEKEFSNTYLLLKRDLLLDMILLGILNEENEEMKRFVKENLMPRAPELENMGDIKKIKEEIAYHCHILAQGLRRLIHTQAELKSMAGREFARARKVMKEARKGPRVREPELVGAGV